VDVRLLIVPYHLGGPEGASAHGPDRLLAAGLEARLASAGARLRIERVDRAGRFRNEAASSLEVAGAVRGAVERALDRGEFPLVLAGDCSTAVGTAAGLAARERLAVVWLDAHGDFNTPETTASGNFDGMSLAVCVGRCWTHVAATLAGLRPLPEDRVLLVGVRALDPLEDALLASSEVAVLTARRLTADGGAGTLDRRLRELATRATAAYLHVDLDVVDAAEAPANEWAVAGGPSAAEVERVIGRVAAHLPVRAAALTAYDPGADPEGRAAEAGLGLIAALVRAAAAASTRAAPRVGR
jgi:arginase